MDTDYLKIITLMMGAANTSVTSVYFYEIMQYTILKALIAFAFARA
jgi:hypothetical protein